MDTFSAAVEGVENRSQTFLAASRDQFKAASTTTRGLTAKAGEVVEAGRARLAENKQVLNTSVRGSRLGGWVGAAHSLGAAMVGLPLNATECH
jgi:hypothetical protein